jgi:hypothetical protein
LVFFPCRKAGAAAVEEGEGEGIQELFEEAEYNLKQSVLKRLADAREGRTEDRDQNKEEEEEEKIEETDGLGESALCRNYYVKISTTVKPEMVFCTLGVGDCTLKN